MTDWPAAASATFAGAGLLATAWQVRGGIAESAKQRTLEIEGVCASWHPTLNPRPNEVDADGFAEWNYEFFVHNPGQFPISSIELRVNFPVEFQRVRGQHLDDPTHELRMVHPVLAGANQRRWSRALRMRYSNAVGVLDATTAAVSFLDAQGTPRRTDWPRARM